MFTKTGLTETGRGLYHIFVGKKRGTPRVGCTLLYHSKLIPSSSISVP